MQIIWFTIFSLLARNVRSIDETSTLKQVPGILLRSNSSGLCTESSLANTDNFEICTFFQLKDGDPSSKYNYTIFELRDYKNVFQLQYGRFYSQFQILYKENIFKYPKVLQLGEWIKLCITVTNGTDIKLEINYRITRNVSEGLQWKKVTIKEDETISNLKNLREQQVGLTPKVFLCAGSYEVGVGSVTGAFVGSTLKSPSVVPKYHVKDACINDVDHETVTSFPGVLKHTYGDVVEGFYSLKGICWDTHVFILLDDPSYFDEHLERCHNLNGRLVQHDELVVYIANLMDIYVNNINKSVDLEDEDDYTNKATWLYGGTEGATSLTIFCPAFNLVKKEFLSLPCIIELDYNFCMVSKYADFYYYGPLKKYDKFYTLQTKMDAVFLNGDEGTMLEKQDDYWILHSQLHKEFVILHNVTIPVGRNKWKSSEEYILTFTYCDPTQFSCSSGYCLTLETRCNGTVECYDSSDEENCTLINKKSGYAKSRTPPPRKGESLFTVKYFAHVFSIADISTSDGIAVVDACVTMTWYDPRIIFNNPVPDAEIDCSEIWSPLMSMADGAYSGFQITFASYRSSCIVLSSNFKSTFTKQRSDRDPYMGQFVDGNDLPISYLFAGLITVPCRFDLRKYPFGVQTCNISFWPDNALLTSNYKMESQYPIDYEGSRNSNELMYYGRKHLGEFLYLNATHNLERNNKMVVLTFKLQNMFGFHMLNSFTPSFLISLIAYFTLFFPIKDFNERVMVSLTALLVLAALFTQASGTSVKTPYFKYLDIWYVVHITFCFFIVVANMMIHKVESLQLKRLKREEKEENSSMVDSNILIWVSKKTEEVNLFFEIIFALFMMVFILIYSLSASDLI